MALMAQQVLIGLDSMKMIDELELFGPSEVEFGFEELDDEVTNGGDDEDEDDDSEDDDDDADDEYDRVST